MNDSPDNIFREHRLILDLHGETLDKHDAAIRGLTSYSETCMRDRRRHEDKIEEFRLNQMLLTENQKQMKDTQEQLKDTQAILIEEQGELRAVIKSILESNKTMCSSMAKQAEQTKIIADVVTTATTLKKVLVLGALVVTSLGTILGGIAFGISWLLTMPIPGG